MKSPKIIPPSPQLADAATAKQHLKQGLDHLTRLLAPTFGPIGRVVAHQQYPNRPPELLTDSATIVRRVMSLGNPQLDIGAMLLRNLVWRTTQRVGDGGTLTALLAQAMVEQAIRMIAAGANPMVMRDGIKLAVEAAISALQTQARPLNSADELAGLALTLTQNRDLAAILGELRYLLGAEGQVIIEDFVAPYMERRYLTGASYPAQISSAYLYTQPNRKQAVLTNTAFILVDDALTQATEAVALLEAVRQRGQTSVAILAGRISDSALGVLVANQKSDKSGLTVTAARLQSLGEEKRYALHDLALQTGATVLGQQYERSPLTVQPSDVGQAGRVEIDDKRIIIVPTPQSRPTVQAEVSTLRQRLAELPLDDADRENLSKRLARLSGGIGELRLGAATKSERAMLHSQAEQALTVLGVAMRGGVVAGGGAALIHCRPAVDALDLSGEMGMGAQVVAQALDVPLRRLLTNSGVANSALMAHRVAEAGPEMTFDVLTQQLVNSYETQIVDACPVIETALRTAASGALMAMTTDVIVYHRNPETSYQP